MLFSQLRLGVRLLREPSVSLLLKALPLAAVLYAVSPLDFIPDVLPILGQLDDVGVIAVALEGFIRLCPAGAVDFHRTALANGTKYTPMPLSGTIIDVEFHRQENRP